MKRALALTALVLALGAAASGCRSAREARQPAPEQPVRPAAAQTTAPATKSGTVQQQPPADVSTDLSDVDKMLREMDAELAKADQTPADGD
jgi:hypothetical protein